ncbi:hypothetical protein M8J76_001696 [Diaphorina citri]|nr:hypothetical protein M8J76_002253 [Diaphorina citri]KAI5748757.1 hypothetical protein M8J76_001696 [Diaphorina citri]
MVVDVEEVELLGTADKACQVQILKPQPPKPHVRSKAIQTDIISKTKPKKAVVPPSLTDYLSPEKNMVAPTEAVQDTSFHLSDIEENTSDSGSSDSIDAHLYLSYNLKLMLRKPSGRLTDMYIVEDCGYLEKLSAGSVVLADRGFKQLETLLHKKQCSLKRPPSVSAGVKLTKDQVKETKKIASLRVHVERVIKRLREYKFLDAHSRFHHNLLKNIDAVVIIAAALSNCQTPIISES